MLQFDSTLAEMITILFVITSKVLKIVCEGEKFCKRDRQKDLDVSSVEMITIFFVNSGNDHNFFSSGGIGHT